jgi:hypothetical protein
MEKQQFPQPAATIVNSATWADRVRVHEWLYGNAYGCTKSELEQLNTAAQRGLIDTPENRARARRILGL